MNFLITCVCVQALLDIPAGDLVQASLGRVVQRRLVGVCSGFGRPCHRQQPQRKRERGCPPVYKGD